MNRTQLICGGLVGLALSAAASSTSAAPITMDPLTTFGGGDGYIAPGERGYLPSGTGNAERGLAYNPVTNHVYVISRTGGVNVAVLDGNTGADVVPAQAMTGLAEGTFLASHIRVANDGAI